MHNVVLSPIDLDLLIKSISDRVTADVLKAVNSSDLPTESAKEFLTIQQASEFLCLSVPTIYSKVSKRELPYMKQGKRLYFAKSELSEYLKAGKKKTSAEMEAENYLVTTKK